jgi:hypothetical protein
MMRRALCLFMVIVLAFLAGCAAQMRTSSVMTMTPEEKETLLRQRITEFWNFMVYAEWSEAYPYYDPFYRAIVTREGFLASKGLLKYHAFNIEQMEIKGNIADVKIKVDFEAPEIVIKGRTTNIPRQERIIVARWLWIYDNWYLEFAGGPMHDRFTDY